VLDCAAILRDGDRNLAMKMKLLACLAACIASALGAPRAWAAPAAAVPNLANTYMVFLLYGQSKSAGYFATAPIDTAAAYPNYAKMPVVSSPANMGVRLITDNADPTQVFTASNATGLTALLEQTASNASLSQSDGETACSGLTFTLNDLIPGYHVICTSHGVSAMQYSAIAQGTQPYTNWKTWLARLVALAQPSNVIVAGIFYDQGESDSNPNGGNSGCAGVNTPYWCCSGSNAGTCPSQATYESDLMTLQQNVTADAQKITGQSAQVPLFVAQIADWTKYGSATSIVPAAQLAAAQHNPDRIFLCNPQYILTPQSDGVHLTAATQERQGNYWAQCYKSVVVDGQHWGPFAWTAVSSDNANPAHITLTYGNTPPVGALKFDTANIGNPGNDGFTYSDASGCTVSSVAIQNGNQVKLTMSGACSASSRTVSYANSGTSGNGAGPTTGARGNLCDSSNATDRSGGATLENCAVAQSQTF
jgi:hypothetical protein